MKRVLCLLWILSVLFGMVSCANRSFDTSVPEIQSTVTQDTKYGAANVNLSQTEFENAGFQLGDSCDIVFGTGITIEDVPYYNGYYVKNAMPVIVAYPGFSTISITYNNAGIWETAGLQEGETVTIRLHQSQKYSAIQSSLGQIYSFERTAYTSDEEFCNFRALSGGKLKENYLFRGASPVDNSRGRAAYTDQLLEKNGIRLIVDLADSQEDMEGYLSSETFCSSYTKSLYESGNVILLSMGSSYYSDSYIQKVATGMKALLNAEGPVYIHCMEGKDRTGFVCTLIEALAGASYEEMRADYMETYRNYYKVSKDGTSEKYEAITELYFDAFLIYLHDASEDPESIKQADFTDDAVSYLIRGGMTAEEVKRLQEKITQ